MIRTLPAHLMLTAVIFCGLVAAGHTAEPSAGLPTIAVEAEGKVSAVPDLGLLNLEVQTQKAQAQDAVQENSRRADALLKALKQALGPEDQVKTLSFHLKPVYAPQNKTAPPEIKGYQAVHRFQVKAKGPEWLGALIDLALKNGASGVNGPYWEYSRIEELQRQAAVAALEKARRLAEALAQAQGFKITGVEKISTGVQPRPIRYGEARALSAGVPAPTTPIEVGEEEIKASLQVVFQVSKQ